MVLAAEAPDLDVLLSFYGPVTAFAHHRGFTHTFVGSPFVAAFAVGCVYLLHRIARHRLEEVSPPRWKLLFLFAWIAAVSHILLDFTNNYGVRPFAPVSYRWYSWDIVFIVEPLLWIVLFLGLVLPFLFALITQEIGARREANRGRGGAMFALICMLLIWGIRDYQHRKAVAALNSMVYEGAEPRKISAMPYPMTPFTWHGIVETDTFFEAMMVDSLSGAVDPQGRAQIRYKPEETAVTLAAKGSFLGRVYLDWARFPLLEVERNQKDGSSEVRFQDLRFSYDPMGRNDSGSDRPLRATVVVDKNLKVVQQRFGRRIQPD